MFGLLAYAYLLVNCSFGSIPTVNPIENGMVFDDGNAYTFVLYVFSA